MKFFQAITLILVTLHLSCCIDADDEDISVMEFFADIANDVCHERGDCFDKVLEDLIFLISGDPYDPTDRDTGSTRMTVLLEVIDDKCEMSEECTDNLLAKMRDRVMDESEEYNDAINDEIYDEIDDETSDVIDEEIYELNQITTENTETRNEPEEILVIEIADNDEELVEYELSDTYTLQMNQNDDDKVKNESEEASTIDKPSVSLQGQMKKPDDNVDDDGAFKESIFERFELKEDLDETILNMLVKNECQQNRAECVKWVAKQKKLGLNHVGKITRDKDGNPVVEVPLSVIFEGELNIADGSDDPE